ncbi:MAG: lipase family protein [Flavisolibacter sp.]
MKRVLFIFFLFLSFQGMSQPANEINCFQNFQYDYVGNSKVNAYLLMMLNHWVYPTAIIGTPDDNDPRVKDLHDHADKFMTEYQKKVGHYFFNPNAVITVSAPLNTSVQLSPAIQKTSITETTTPTTTLSLNRPAIFKPVFYNGGNGYDPEAVVISTDKYIIVVFRGTDRVASNIQTPLVGALANYFVYSFSEWVVTDFNFAQTTPLEGMTGKVHTGFNTSLNFIKERLEDTLAKYGAAQKKIWITGHSLGAAQAQLFGVYLRKKFPSWDIKGVYAFAAPHVGDANFVEQMNQLLPGARLQRFDFMDDPITNLPAYFMGYQRAGIRNLYTKEQGANYNFNTNEASFDLGKFFFCLHHTEWYARAAFFELLDHQPELQGKIPNAPERPSEACSNIDLAYVTGSPNLLTAGNADLPEGTYNVVLSKGNKYLNAPPQTADQNGTLVQVGNPDNTPKNNQWIIKKVPGALIESYTLQYAQGGKFLDADLLNTDNNGCKVQLWDRGLGLRTNQEWKIVRLTNGAYQIINVKSDSKALDAPDNCANGCKLQLFSKTGTDATQQWFFVRVQ